MINLKKLISVVKEMYDITIEFFLIKRNPIFQHYSKISRLVVYKEAFDISRKGSHKLTKNKKNKKSVAVVLRRYIFIFFYLRFYSYT